MSVAEAIASLRALVGARSHFDRDDEILEIVELTRMALRGDSPTLALEIAGGVLSGEMAGLESEPVSVLHLIHLLLEYAPLNEEVLSCSLSYLQCFFPEVGSETSVVAKLWAEGGSAGEDIRLRLLAATRKCLPLYAYG